MDERRLSRLTEQQRTALRLVYAHMTSKEIAPLMGIEPGSVDQHIKAAMRTLGVGDRRSAARILAEHEAGISPLASYWNGDDIAPDRHRIEAAFRTTKIRQAPLGAIFEPQSDYLAIDPAGDTTDHEVALQDVVRQLHPEILRKTRRFASLAARLDNQVGWQGITGLCERLIQLLDRPIETIPDHLGTLYSATLELGSFVEMDLAIRAGKTTYATPLDAEVRRPLEDAVRGLAPWLRSFPTIRKLDDEAGQFLMPPLGLDTSAEVIDSANRAELIKSEDAEILTGLVEAAKRGDFQGSKAERRGYLSARNMIVAVAGLFGGLILGDYASKSILIGKAGTFLAEAEIAIGEVVSNLPIDIRSAIELIVAEGQKPALPSHAPEPIGGDGQPRFRRPGRDEDDSAQIGGTLFHMNGGWYVRFAGGGAELVPLLQPEFAESVLEKSHQYTVLGRVHLTGGQPSGFTLSDIVSTGEPPEPTRRGLF